MSPIQFTEPELIAIAYKHSVPDMADAIHNLRRDLRRAREALDAMTRRAEAAESRNQRMESF